jgi:DNA-binding NarL/FixJ family response regulator
MYQNDAMSPTTQDAHTAIVCENEPEVRTLVTRLVVDAGFEVAGAVDKAIDAIELARLVRPTVVVVDHDLPGLPGLEAIPELLEAAPDSEVLLVTNDDRLYDEAMQAGAFGVVYKSRLPELSGALGRVVEFRENAGERDPSERRTGKDRRQRHDWNKVTSERRSGDDRRQTREQDERPDHD